MNSKPLLTVLSGLILASVQVRGAEPAGATVLLNTLGYTSGQSILLTHMAVGTLGDAFVGKAYKADKANAVLSTYINVTNGMKEQMKKLLDAGVLAKDDVQFVQKCLSVLDLVLKEAQDLKTYFDGKKNEDAQAYDNSRKEALKEIKVLLNIKD